MTSQPRVRESDGAVWVEGIGYVAELFTYGSKEAAQKAAEEANNNSQHANISNSKQKGSSAEIERMGFG